MQFRWSRSRSFLVDKNGISDRQQAKNGVVIDILQVAAGGGTVSINQIITKWSVEHHGTTVPRL